MRTFYLPKLGFALVLGTGLLMSTHSFAGTDDELEPFGGQTHAGVINGTLLTEVPVVSMRVEPVLLAQLATPENDVNDPLESVNRVIFEFNEIVYTNLFTPVAKTYNNVFPATFRLGLSNVIDNISSPVTFVNDILQLELNRALTTFARFLVNSTIGMVGMADVASTIGLEQHTEDFGQTLGSYGVGEGLYLVLPLLGPNNPRDAIGKYLVDPYFDPLGLYLSNTDRDNERMARMGVGALDEYSGIVNELEQIKKTSVDYYAAIRSLYRQKRLTEISNGRDEGLPSIPNYDLNFAPDKSNSIAGVK